MNVQVRQIKSDIVELVFNPKEEDLRVGENLSLREKGSDRGLIVQVVEFRTVTYPSLLLEMLQLVAEDSQRLPPSLFQLYREGLPEMSNLKVAIAKIRKVVLDQIVRSGVVEANDQGLRTRDQVLNSWDQWDGWIPTRDVVVERTTDEEVFANCVHDYGNSLYLGKTLSGKDFLVEGQDLEKVNIITGVKGAGKCIVQGTLIPTECGLLAIEEICPRWKPGWNTLPQPLLVQTPDGPRTATALYAGDEQATIRIRTRFGFTLEGTPEHPIWCMHSDGRDGWRALSEIKVGDYIAIQRHDALWGNCDVIQDFVLPTLHPHNTTTRMPNLPAYLDEAVGYLLGILVGDGTVGYPSGRVDLTPMDREVITAFRAWANRIGLVAHQARTKPRTWYISNIIHRAWLEHLGLGRVCSREKVVPHALLRASHSVVRAFLCGLFDTDGSALGAKGIEFGTSSERLAHQVQLLLLQFGIVASLRRRKGNTWRLRLRGDNARRFYREIGFQIARKQKRESELPTVSNTNVDIVPHFRATLNADTARALGSYRNYARGHATPSYATLRQMAQVLPEAAERLNAPPYFWDQVEEVTTGYGRVFDLHVPEGHAFVANGIISHNSHLAKVLLLQLIKHGAPCIVFDINREYIHLPPHRVDRRTGQVQERGVIHLEAGGNFKLGVYQFGLVPLLTMLSKYGLPEVSAMHFENRVARLFAEIRGWKKQGKEPPFIGLEQLIQMAEENEFGGGSQAMIINRAIRSRLEALRNTGIFARNSKEAVSLYERYHHIRDGGALIIDISRLGNLARAGLVQAIIEMIKDICEEEIKGGRDHFPFVFFEEAHLYVSRFSIDYIVTRARHLGITSFFVTNMITGLDEAVLRQADNLFLLYLPFDDDVRHVSKSATTDYETMSSFVRRLRGFHAMAIGNVTGKYPLIFRVDGLEGVNTAGETKFFFKAGGREKRGQMALPLLSAVKEAPGDQRAEER